MRKFLVCLSFPFAFLLSCVKQDNDGANRVIARVGNKFVSVSDLEKIIPKEVSSEDSVRLSEDFIQRWIRNQLMVQKANENLTDEQKNLEKEIEEYRNSLLIFRYKQALFSEKMDTVVLEEEIDQYYKQFPDNFILTQNIVKGTFIQVPLDVADPKKIKDLAVSEEEDEMKKLDVYCIQYARKYDHFNDSWISFDDIASNLPISIKDERNFIRKHKTFEVKDSTDFYFVVLKNFKLKGDKAPMEYVNDRITSLILNRRKIEFIHDLEESVYNEGVNEQKFQIFN